MFTFNVKQTLRRIFYERINTVPSCLSFLIIFRDFLLRRIFRLGPPFGIWTKSYLSWIFFDFSASMRKSLTYILPSREKKLVEMSREKVEINKNKSYAPLVSVIIPTYNRAETL